MIDLQKLAELCAKATRGPYIIQGLGCQGPHRFIRIASGNCEGATLGDIHGVCKVAKHNAEANAAYIASVDPQTVQALIKAVKAAQALLEWSDIVTEADSDAADLLNFHDAEKALRDALSAFQEPTP